MGERAIRDRGPCEICHQPVVSKYRARMHAECVGEFNRQRLSEPQLRTIKDSPVAAVARERLSQSYEPQNVTNLLPQKNEPQGRPFDDPRNNARLNTARNEGRVPGLSPIRVAVFDIETTGLNAGFGVVLCAVIKFFGPDETRIYRADDYPAWQKGERANDKDLVADILAGLEEADIVVGHNACVAPGQRVLTADLRWVPVETLKAGDRLLNFSSEPNPRRMWEVGTVSYAETIQLERFKITLSDGTELIATEDHPWLVGGVSNTPEGLKSRGGYRWSTTKNLNSKKNETIIHRMIEPWDDPTTYEQGWLAGFYDGEGNCSQPDSSTKRYSGHNALTVTVSQKPGPTYDRAVRYLTDLGFKTGQYHYDPKNKNIKSITIKGGATDRLRFLGSVRPKRLLDQFNPEKLASIKHFSKTPLTVKSIESIGMGEVIALQVSNGTYIVEGFGSHNCKFDVPFLRTRAMVHNLPAVNFQKIIDPVQLARQHFRFPGNSLQSIQNVIGTMNRKTPLVPEVWQRATMNGDKDAMDSIVEHCVYDVEVLTEVMFKMRGYVRKIDSLGSFRG